MKKRMLASLASISLVLLPGICLAGEADLKIPELNTGQTSMLSWLGGIVCVLGLLFSAWQYVKVKNIGAHKSMTDVAEVIFQTCKTYLKQQGRFLLILFALIGTIMSLNFGALQGSPLTGVLLVLGWTVIGILGSYAVAWYGIRMNTLANSRMAFASLKKKPLNLLHIPLDAGMSIGVMLVSIELIMMLAILLFVPRHLAGASFIGFAIGESLGASVLRIAGGIFTKIADIGADLMKVVFKIKEDDPRNPGVIADCVGDNAGDSVGPSADGFETYGVTGVALISFIVLAVGFIPGIDEATRILYQTSLLTWVFLIRIMMVVISILSFWLNKFIANALYKNSIDIDFEKPLTNLIWITSILSIAMTFGVSYWLLGDLPHGLWLTLSLIVSLGTLSAALIPEITKIFTSTKSTHVKEIVKASREGGASLNIISGLVDGNFSAFWMGIVFILIMFAAFVTSSHLGSFMIYPAIFSFGLVAFGMLGMGPVTIAVDSYGPVTDNAQSIYELSQIENIPGIENELNVQLGFKPDFTKAKYYLEANDAAGNTFKATAKPVLIGTAVVGSLTMIFSIILVIKNQFGVAPESILNILNPWSIFGLIAGGAVVHWFVGASMQAVSTGAYRAVEYIKKHIRLDENADSKASLEQSKEVVKICTQSAQKGMYNIFAAVLCMASGIALISAYRDMSVEDTSARFAAVSFFVYYLLAIAIFGLKQAIFMANAGGAWDNAKKIVEVELDEKGTALHDATVVGDTVGDPFKDTSSVSLNPIIKFTTLFGLLAIEIAISPKFYAYAPYVGVALVFVALYFVWKSFYGMRIN